MSKYPYRIALINGAWTGTATYWHADKDAALSHLSFLNGIPGPALGIFIENPSYNPMIPVCATNPRAIPL